MVYLKELDAGGGFVVYTNLGTSRKAADLASNPHAALAFWWPALQRQVRVDTARAQAYFDTRARASRDDDDDGDDGGARLDEWVAEADARFRGVDDIPVPDFWGGLRIVPDAVEFWQGRDSRLHDRFVYRRRDGGAGAGDRWELSRLSP